MSTTSAPRARDRFVSPPTPLVRFARTAVVVLVLVVGASSCTPRLTVAELDRKVFATSAASFHRWWRQEQARAQHVPEATIERWLASSPRRLDSAAARARAWDVSTDLCSFAPDTGPAFDFRRPCIRHDVAWRNLRRLGRSQPGVDTWARRLAASRQFLRDMQTTCSHRPLIQQPMCHAVARAYFEAVAAVS